ncbi:FecR domain-containing protein [Chitinophaga horti]|uniref:FecR domain-containing protein n=1 Tax=Chitinophaga horti TaxID=2920382 RepID=A0ABY6J368_9BACT|nr:FecR domain-containing protein [Chitinophaga horti]UYQ94114.1 FecR domain-containing protein [Chitinophaga horti]
MEQPGFYINLFNRLLEGNCTASDTEKLVSWLGSEHPDPLAAELILRQYEQSSADVDPAVRQLLDDMLPAILDAPPAKVVAIRKRRYWPAVAAAVVALGIVGAGLFWQQRTSKPTVQTEDQLVIGPDVMPGSNKALLTLADGRQVPLDSTGSGAWQQGGAAVNQQGGELVYDNNAGEVVYNTLTTPRGGQFRVVLPDGSKVWLNASSSLRFPVAFSGKERVVEVEGQAYFEVTASAEHPFIVNTPAGPVTALGTSFDIMAYKDEPTVNTTLVTGNVQVKGSGVINMRPGSQVQVKPATGAMNLRTTVNVNNITAWKNGYFIFDNDPIQSVMRQIQRWYDVEVRYEGTMAEGHINGEFPRDYTLSEVLNILITSGVNCRLENGTLIVK